MSIRSETSFVRYEAIKNLKNDSNNFSNFQTQLLELKNSEKNDNVLDLLKSI